ncbi:YlxR family protein [Desulfovibrio sp. OttesenSCG-928-I05]|nr:YlxR family protein [Desulfovibrio sp. OttesenSCG-928-I05]
MSDLGKLRHIPARMCVICRKRFPKGDILRFVSPEGSASPVPDPRQVLPGRGMYVCPDDTCRERFAKKHAKRQKGV